MGSEYVGGRATRMTNYILARDGGVCCWCGGVATTAEHIVPQSLGGAIWDPANLAAACRPCNSNRRNRPRPTRVPARPSRTWGGDNARLSGVIPLGEG